MRPIAAFMLLVACDVCRTLPDVPEAPCPGFPGLAADDPCCDVQTCLADADDACAEQPVCAELAPADVVCGDQMCGDVECSECECSPAYACADMFVDSFAGDVCQALRYCAPEFPGCLRPRFEALGCDGNGGAS